MNFLGALLVPGNGISNMDLVIADVGWVVLVIVEGSVSGWVSVDVSDVSEVKGETEIRLEDGKIEEFWLIDSLISEEVDGSGSVDGYTNDLRLELKTVSLLEDFVWVILDERRTGGLTGLGTNDLLEEDVLTDSCQDFATHPLAVGSNLWRCEKVGDCCCQ